MSKDLTKRSLEQEVEFAIRKGLMELLESKQLYQSVTVDLGGARSLLPQLSEEEFRGRYTVVSSNRLPSEEQMHHLKDNIRRALADRMAKSKCAFNSLHRFYQGEDRPLNDEIHKIVRLSKSYQPFGNDIRRVIISEDLLQQLR